MGVCFSIGLRRPISLCFKGFDLSGLNHPKVLARDTIFSEDEVYALFQLFKTVSSTVEADGHIDEAEFRLAIFKTQKSNMLIDRIFVLFDGEPRNGQITFGEFVRTLNVFHPGCPIDQKIGFAFRIYDISDTGTIGKDAIRELLMSIVNDSEDLAVPASAIDEIVERTFDEVDLDSTGTIDFEEFRTLVRKNPSVIRYMTLPMLEDVTTRFPSFLFHPKLSGTEWSCC